VGCGALLRARGARIAASGAARHVGGVRACAHRTAIGISHDHPSDAKCRACRASSSQTRRKRVSMTQFVPHMPLCRAEAETHAAACIMVSSSGRGRELRCTAARPVAARDVVAMTQAAGSQVREALANEVAASQWLKRNAQQMAELPVPTHELPDPQHWPLHGVALGSEPAHRGKYQLGSSAPSRHCGCLRVGYRRSGVRSSAGFLMTSTPQPR